MPVVDLVKHNPISQLSRSGLTGEGGPISWITQANQFINSLTTLMNTINNNPLIGQITGARAQGGNQIINSGPGAKQMKNVTPQTPQAQGMDDQAMMNYFSTPEGLGKIADAIEQIIPFTGDCKLSVLKSEINKLAGNLGGEKTDPENNAASAAPKAKVRKRVSKKKK